MPPYDDDTTPSRAEANEIENMAPPESAVNTATADDSISPKHPSSDESPPPSSSSSPDHVQIPVIDLSDPNDARLIHQISDACSTWGFFQLIHHGVPPEIISNFRRASADFFAMPHDAKLKLKRGARNARGYFDDELTKRRKDWKEAYDVGVPGSRDWSAADDERRNDCLDGSNLFPAEGECPGFRDAVVAYFDACAELSDRIASLMARALVESLERDIGGEDGTKEELNNECAGLLERLREGHTSYLRMNYYPTCDCGASSSSAPASQSLPSSGMPDPPPLGISPHRDAGFLTVLLQDDSCHSLQVARFEDGDNGDDDGVEWVTVRPVPGSLTINTGDMAMMWSNGKYRAPLHRVLTDPLRERYSAPFFYNPAYDERISPLVAAFQKRSKGDDSTTTTLAAAAQAMSLQSRYRPCVWGYFRALRFAGDLTDLGVEIQTSYFRVLSDDAGHTERQERFVEEVDFDAPFDVERYRSILES